MFPSPRTQGFTVYTKDNCKYCSMVKELIPDATYINSEPFLLDKKEEFLIFIQAQLSLACARSALRVNATVSRLEKVSTSMARRT